MADQYTPCSGPDRLILELIHAESPNFLEGMYLLNPKAVHTSAGFLVIHDNCSNRMVIAPTVLHQISALSTSDGTVVDYHGCNG